MSDIVTSQSLHNLHNIIKDKILDAKNNSISFAEFMALALYHEQFGYYINSKIKIGATGDFITAPTIGSMFARCLINYIKNTVENISSPKILEFGAGNGQLAFDILSNIDLAVEFEYLILEPSANLRILQQEKLQKFSNVKWITSLPKNKFDGVILANEVLDAMPVHLFCYANRNFYERRVALQQDTFQLINCPVGNHLMAAINKLELADLPDLYCSEISLLHVSWAATVHKLIRTGSLLIIDYGFLQHEYYHPQRNMGTIIAHYQHRVCHDILDKVGEQDLTTHVNFSPILSLFAEEQVCFGPMSEFLLHHNLLEIYQELVGAAKDDETQLLKLRQELNLLTSPAEMGDLFKVFEYTV